MKAQMGDSVSVRYTGRLDTGEVFDTNDDDETDALVFRIGSGDVIPGFDKAVLGLGPGESRTVRIPPEEAYGARDERLVQSLPRSVLGGAEPEIGQHLDLEDDSGNVWHADVVKFDADTVTVDLNPHLAGEALTFDIRVETVKKA